MDPRAVGIIGAGTVGSALIAAFEGHRSLLVRDPVLGERSASMADMVRHCQVVFVAVPTPQAADGGSDLTDVRAVIDEFGPLAGTDGPVLCVKSAVPPDAVAQVQQTWPNLRLVMSPEFLRERSAVDDMLATRSLVLGGEPRDCAVVADLFRDHSSVHGPLRTSDGLDAVGAAFLKYQENCFLAMKVSFMNEFFDAFERCGSEASWSAVQRAFHLDHERMGTTHWQVPGPDGRRGWGGRCLPKDVAAMRRYAEQLGVETPLLRAICERNHKDRSK